MQYTAVKVAQSAVALRFSGAKVQESAVKCSKKVQ